MRTENSRRASSWGLLQVREAYLYQLKQVLTANTKHKFLCACLCVCVEGGDRETETERGREGWGTLVSMGSFLRSRLASYYPCSVITILMGREVFNSRSYNPSTYRERNAKLLLHSCHIPHPRRVERTREA